MEYEVFQLFYEWSKYILIQIIHKLSKVKIWHRFSWGLLNNIEIKRWQKRYWLWVESIFLLWISFMRWFFVEHLLWSFLNLSAIEFIRGQNWGFDRYICSLITSILRFRVDDVSNCFTHHVLLVNADFFFIKNILSQSILMKNPINYFWPNENGFLLSKSMIGTEFFSTYFKIPFAFYSNLFLRTFPKSYTLAKFF